MKKIILTVAITALFVFYIIYQQGATVPALPAAGKDSSQTAAKTGKSAGISTSSTAAVSSGQYKDGQYTGQSVDAYFGNVQTKAVILGGRLADIQILDSPRDRDTSLRISNQALPVLVQEAISSQNAQVDVVSGATQTSEGFMKSLASALSQAK